MRIISGKYKGKKLLGHDIDGTRPTMSRVRESLFAMLNPYLKNAVVLDLFAGTGLLGIEALSNGAAKCVFVENNKKMFKLLKKNIEDIENTELFCFDFKKIEGKYDIIFLDPPYNKDFIQQSLNLIKEKDLLNNGIIVCEYENEVFDILDFKIIKEKKYGSKKIMVLKK